MTAELVLSAEDIVGESPLWVAAESALYWVDIVGSRIHRFEPGTGRHDLWRTPEYPTSIGLRKDGGFIVGLRQRVTLWRPDGPFETFAVPEPGTPGNRLNEGAVAPDGSYWVGTMAENIGPDGGPQRMAGDTGHLYRIAPDGGITRLTDDAFGITNTMVWTDDGRFVTADTMANALYVYDCPSPTALTGRRQFLGPLERGVPDGSTRDARGNIYNARVAGGASIACLGPDGRLNSSLELPCRSPTSCVFGGADLSTLFVTSSRFGMSARDLAANANDGGLFAVDGVSRGLPTTAFGA